MVHVLKKSESFPAEPRAQFIFDINAKCPKEGNPASFGTVIRNAAGLQQVTLAPNHGPERPSPSINFLSRITVLTGRPAVMTEALPFGKLHSTLIHRQKDCWNASDGQLPTTNESRFATDCPRHWTGKKQNKAAHARHRKGKKSQNKE